MRRSILNTFLAIFSLASVTLAVPKAGNTGIHAAFDLRTMSQAKDILFD